MELRKFGIVLLLLTNPASCDDLRQYAVYEDIEVAKADGADNRGWLPEWIPSDAINIHEHHDLDTNDQAISFALVDGGKFEYPDACTIATSPKRPRITTKLFPKSVHKLSGVHFCNDLYVVTHTNTLVHVWGNQIYLYE